MNNDNQANKNNINIEQTAQTAHQELNTFTVKKPWYKKPITFIVIILILILIGGIIYWFVFKEKSSNVTNNENISTSTDTELQSDAKMNAPIKLVSIKSELIKGLRLNVPRNWTIVENSAYETIQFYSPDAVEETAGYGTMAKGTSITFNRTDRNFVSEAGKTDPLDAYTFDKELVNGSSYLKFTNKNNVKMMAGPAGYEGCYELVIFLTETTEYSLRISQGPGCPNNDILENDRDVKEFINGIEIAPDNMELTFSGAHIMMLQGDKTDTKTTVTVPNMLFSFNALQKFEKYYLLNNQPFLAKFTEDDDFYKLQIGSNKSDMITMFGCDACGSTSLTYDESLEFQENEKSTEGFEKISDNLYGKAEDVKPVQDKGTAKIFTYVKKMQSGTFTYTVTLEKLNTGYGNDPVIPEFNDVNILNMLDSIQIEQ